MANVLALIDADGLGYQSSKESLVESISILDEKIRNIIESTGATHYSIFLSSGPYFRHKIDPMYKSSRGKYGTPLKWIKTLKSYLFEGYNGSSMMHVEADDLVSYWYEHPIIVNADENTPITVFERKILCSTDKDLLKSIPGKHFNYTYVLKEKENPNSLVKGWWVETSEEEANTFKLMQMLVGDSTDGIKGVEGRGEVYFKNMLVKKPNLGMLDILSEYIIKYGDAEGVHEFQKNYKLLHMLDSDKDFVREVLALPSFPNINKVIISETGDITTVVPTDDKF